ncbi:threonine/serine exporter ThrE family protein [Prevotella sp. 10(H)]|uniref:threonine/serine ThrE exporter family protein n=1 Tax=Prevotella sp. 10(H) TaxID=1158294 RepID=UPI0004A6B441|nr:threonine/serine exporter family protein [Prevotella sp. 10(H)]
MAEERYIKEKIPAQRFADLILDIGTFLLASGAHCGRLNSNIGRLASTWEFDINMNPTFKGLLVTVKDKNDPANSITCYKTSPSHNVHLAILTAVSHMSWKVQEENLSISYVEKEFAKIKSQQNYSDLVVAVAVGFSCAGLCLFSAGDEKNALLTFIAAFIGYMVRVFFSKKNFNPMICISIAAFITTLITGAGRLYNFGEHPEAAMATAVLYLIPGVPLINCVIDLIEGYLSSAINRALFGGFILLCIAAGMTLCITLLGINNF